MPDAEVSRDASFPLSNEPRVRIANAWRFANRAELGWNRELTTGIVPWETMLFLLHSDGGKFKIWKGA
jgi:hypothetical protein